MRFKKYLYEEYLARKWGFPRKRGFEFFINPSFRESKSAGNDGEVRIIADSRTKNLIVFSSDLIHFEALDFLIKTKELKAPNGLPYYQTPDLLLATAKAVGSKLRFQESDQVEQDINDGEPYVKSLLRKDWSWLSTYFSNMEFIDRLRKKAEKIK